MTSTRSHRDKSTTSAQPSITHNGPNEKLFEGDDDERTAETLSTTSSGSESKTLAIGPNQPTPAEVVLQQQLDEKDHVIADLNQQITHLASENQRIAPLNRRIDELATENQRLEAAVTDLEVETAALLINNEELEEENDRLRGLH